MGFWSDLGAAGAATRARAKECRGEPALFDRLVENQFRKIQKIEDQERERRVTRSRSYSPTITQNAEPQVARKSAPRPKRTERTRQPFEAVVYFLLLDILLMFISSMFFVVIVTKNFVSNDTGTVIGLLLGIISATGVTTVILWKRYEDEEWGRDTINKTSMIFGGLRSSMRVIRVIQIVLGS